MNFSGLSLHKAGDGAGLKWADNTTSPLTNHWKSKSMAAMVIMNMDVGSTTFIKWDFNMGTEWEMHLLAAAASKLRFHPLHLPSFPLLQHLWCIWQPERWWDYTKKLVQIHVLIRPREQKITQVTVFTVKTVWSWSKTQCSQYICYQWRSTCPLLYYCTLCRSVQAVQV